MLAKLLLRDPATTMTTRAKLELGVQCVPKLELRNELNEGGG